jgi:hypothetical protein
MQFKTDRAMEYNYKISLVFFFYCCNTVLNHYLWEKQLHVAL